MLNWVGYLQTSWVDTLKNDQSKRKKSVLSYFTLFRLPRNSCFYTDLILMKKLWLVKLVLFLFIGQHMILKATLWKWHHLFHLFLLEKWDEEKLWQLLYFSNYLRLELRKSSTVTFITKAFCKKMHHFKTMLMMQSLLNLVADVVALIHIVRKSPKMSHYFNNNCNFQICRVQFSTQKLLNCNLYLKILRL